MNHRTTHRRGSATIWLIVVLPVLLVLFCFVINIAQQWLARVELENALEAAALAAVKQWGDANGGDTLIPREVGIEYANLNRMRGYRVQIADNYDPVSGGVNQNKLCDVVKGPPPDGNLIFGSVEEGEPGDPVIFNAGIRPSCAAGNVVFDVTSNGELNSDAHNDWGIAFHPTPNMPAGLRINYIVINLRPGGVGTLTFQQNFTLSDNIPATWIVHDNANPRYEQPDLYGFTNYPVQITASYPQPWQLRIDFSADPGPGGDLGFEPCDRFRFGNDVNFGNSLPGNLRDADGIGAIGTEITVGFSDGSVVTGVYVDTTHPKNCSGGQQQCSNFPCDVAQPSLQNPPCPTGLPSQPVKKYVHPTQVDDIPCAAANAPNNNGQALGFVGGPGRRHFAVRAQATVNVSPLCRCLCAFNDDYCVSTKTIAIYDCVTRRPRLIRVDEFICPGP